MVLIMSADCSVGEGGRRFTALMPHYVLRYIACQSTARAPEHLTKSLSLQPLYHRTPESVLSTGDTSSRRC